MSVRSLEGIAEVKAHHHARDVPAVVELAVAIRVEPIIIGARGNTCDAEGKGMKEGQNDCQSGERGQPKL